MVLLISLFQAWLPGCGVFSNDGTQQDPKPPSSSQHDEGDQQTKAKATGESNDDSKTSGLWDDAISCVGVGVNYAGQKEGTTNEPVCTWKRDNLNEAQVATIQNTELLADYSRVECAPCADGFGYFLDLISSDGTFKRYYSSENDHGEQQYYIDRSSILNLYNGDYSGPLCKGIIGKTFISQEEYEVGLSPDGTEVLGHWTISFTQSRFNWDYSDHGDSGNYLCLNGEITTGSLKAKIINEESLLWDGKYYDLAH